MVRSRLTIAAAAVSLVLASGCGTFGRNRCPPADCPCDMNGVSEGPILESNPVVLPPAGPCRPGTVQPAPQTITPPLAPAPRLVPQPSRPAPYVPQ